MGTRTDAAQAAVVAARADLAEEVDRLEAAGRAAVDIPAKVKANPAKAAGVAAGGAFLALGGPKRLFRRAKRAVTGKDDELPSELLPKEVEKAIKRLGSDGRAVRGTLEREFAKYLDDRQKERKKEGVVAAATGLAITALRPIAMRGGRQIAERMLDPNQPAFNEQLAKIRARRQGGTPGAPDDAGL
ncbi:MAG TPA: hypothetical protein VIK65_12070 [Candidatus Limnocylindrales bacterium]